MSTPQVQRLEGLLARVQKNRLSERAAAPTTASAPTQRVEVATPALELPKPPSPLEHAVEAKVAAPAVAPQPVVSMKPVAVGAPAPTSVAAKAQPVATPAAAPAPARPVVAAKPTVDPNAPARVITSPAPPSAPIAATASPHPTMDGPSFGELLRRSLALRPR